MTILFCLASFVAGAVAMAVYSLTHGSQVAKLGAEIMGELAKVKQHIGLK